jgi:hypothetical protein
MLKNIKTMEEVVKDILEEKSQYRDDDNTLVCKVWYNLLKSNGFDIKTKSAYDLMKLYASKELPKASDIERARRKVQEKYPHLRGVNWEKRHDESDNVRQNINKP